MSDMGHSDQMDQANQMNHAEAIKQMAAERYLLDELSPELRDAFEEHVFDCPECALDLRASAAFVTEATVQLPALVAAAQPARQFPAQVKPVAKKRDWFAWLQPALAVPAFAAMLAVIGYQNLATIPHLRTEASEPRVLPLTSVHSGTRSGGHVEVLADRREGAVLLIDLLAGPAYTSYTFTISDPQGRKFTQPDGTCQ